MDVYEEIVTLLEYAFKYKYQKVIDLCRYRYYDDPGREDLYTVENLTKVISDLKDPHSDLSEYLYDVYDEHMKSNILTNHYKVIISALLPIEEIFYDKTHLESYEVQELTRQVLDHIENRYLSRKSHHMD